RMCHDWVMISWAASSIWLYRRHKFNNSDDNNLIQSSKRERERERERELKERLIKSSAGGVMD
ncbi:MAG: hypothetical protein N7Q72_04250, partial [Spiroplasma sp. Tabriz.8]|nr:hypothetical protein [Spiroplasma sp. Tabriz.8]